jgi:hypothetical protein
VFNFFTLLLPPKRCEVKCNKDTSIRFTKLGIRVIYIMAKRKECIRERNDFFPVGPIVKVADDSDHKILVLAL